MSVYLRTNLVYQARPSLTLQKIQYLALFLDSAQLFLAFAVWERWPHVCRPACIELPVFSLSHSHRHV